VWNFEIWMVSEETHKGDSAPNRRTYIWGFHRRVIGDSGLIWDVTLCHWGCSFRPSKVVVEMKALISFEVRELKPSDTETHLKSSESFSLTNSDADPCASILTTITKRSTNQPTNQQNERPTEWLNDRTTGRPTDRLTNQPTERQTERPTDRQTNRPTNQPTNKPASQRPKVWKNESTDQEPK
jgi:hypothetical protein